MGSGLDRLISRQGLHIQQVAKVSPRSSRGESELLIEIAIKKLSLPIHTHQPTTHITASTLAGLWAFTRSCW